MYYCFTILDLETTGLDPANDQIIEVGMLKVKGGEKVDEYHSLVNPGRPLPLKIKNLTGLSDAELVGAPAIGNILPKIREFIGGDPVAGHNVNFDLSFLARYNLSIPPEERFDTLELARILLPAAKSFRLEALAAELGLKKTTKAHRALSDTYTTAELLKVLFLKMENLETDILLKLHTLLLEARSPWSKITSLIAKNAAKTSLLKKNFSSYCWYKTRAFNKGNSEANNENNNNNESHQEKPKPTCLQGEVGALLGKGGTLSSIIPGFEHRPQQESMAKFIDEKLSEEKFILIEAGTGTGKTLAYLIPTLKWCLLNDKKAVIATRTINLQEQLLLKDIPILSKIIHTPFKTALLKGRQNYLCLRRWVATLESRHQPEEALFLARLLVWLTESENGDKSELNFNSLEEDLWLDICSDVESCHGFSCSFDEYCFLKKARAAAGEADLIVTNHSLLFASTAAEATILPLASLLVIDEAHHLENSATTQLSIQFSQKQAGRWLYAASRNILRLLEKAPPSEWSRWNKALQAAQSKKREAEDALRNFFQLLVEAAELLFPDSLSEYGRLNFRLHLLDSVDSPIKDVGKNCCQVIEELCWELSTCIKLMEIWATNNDAWAGPASDLHLIYRKGKEMASNLHFILLSENKDYVYWCALELSQRNQAKFCTLNASPINPGNLIFERLFSGRENSVLVSATLTVDSSFSHFIERSGLDNLPQEKIATARFDSPFDYESQATLFICRDVPVQGTVEDDQYFAALSKALEKIIPATGGKTLVLFTSHRTLREIYLRTKEKIEAQGLYLLGQGIDGNRTKILDEYRAAEKPVLFGAYSFWEGVDLPGQELTCVIIVKLPFLSLADPVVEARLEELEKQKKGGFRSFYMPQAVLRLKQGFGRLIRSRQDYGCVVILDGRLHEKNYGQQFLRSLPVKNYFYGTIDEISRKISYWLQEKPTSS